MQKIIFTLEEFNRWRPLRIVNHFIVKTHFTNNLCQYINLHIYKISRPTQAQSFAPTPQREEATNWSNSDIRTINKIFLGYSWHPKIFPSYSKSRDPKTKYHHYSYYWQIALLYVLPDHHIIPYYYSISLPYSGVNSYFA